MAKPILSVVLPVEMINRNDGQGHAYYRTAKEKKELAATLGHNMLGLRRTPFAHRVDVMLTRILGKGQRLFDPDSIGRGNAKQIVDTLTDLGWWHDDSSKYIRNCDYRQDDLQRENGPAVLIEIWVAP
jgi:hypothetical protein